jgi:hypothetical protein
MKLHLLSSPSHRSQACSETSTAENALGIKAVCLKSVVDGEFVCSQFITFVAFTIASLSSRSGRRKANHAFVQQARRSNQCLLTVQGSPRALLGLRLRSLQRIIARSRQHLVDTRPRCHCNFHEILLIAPLETVHHHLSVIKIRKEKFPFAIFNVLCAIKMLLHMVTSCVAQHN